MEFNPPSSPQPSSDPLPTVGGYQDASRLMEVPPVSNSTPDQVEQAAVLPVIPAKRRHLHLGRLLILLACLGILGSSLFFGGTYLYEMYGGGTEVPLTQNEDTTPSTYAGMSSNQPFLFSYPRGWRVATIENGVEVAPITSSLMSSGKEVPAFTVRVLPYSRQVTAEVLATSFLTDASEAVITANSSFIGLSIPAHTTLTTKRSITVAILKGKTTYIVIEQPVFETINDARTAASALQMFKKSIRFEE